MHKQDIHDFCRAVVTHAEGALRQLDPAIHVRYDRADKKPASLVAGFWHIPIRILHESDVLATVTISPTPHELEEGSWTHNFAITLITAGIKAYMASPQFECRINHAAARMSRRAGRDTNTSGARTHK